MPPPELARYNRADWTGPGDDCGHPECRYWAAAATWQTTLTGDDSDEVLVLLDGPDVPWHDTWG